MKDHENQLDEQFQLALDPNQEACKSIRRSKEADSKRK